MAEEPVHRDHAVIASLTLIGGYDSRVRIGGLVSIVDSGGEDYSLE